MTFLPEDRLLRLELLLRTTLKNIPLNNNVLTQTINSFETVWNNPSLKRLIDHKYFVNDLKRTVF